MLSVAVTQSISSIFRRRVCGWHVKFSPRGIRRVRTSAAAQLHTGNRTLPRLITCFCLSMIRGYLLFTLLRPSGPGCDRRVLSSNFTSSSQYCVLIKSSGEIRFRAHRPNSFKSYFQCFYAGCLRVVKLQVYKGLHILTYLQ